MLRPPLVVRTWEEDLVKIASLWDQASRPYIGRNVRLDNGHDGTRCRATRELQGANFASRGLGESVKRRVSWRPPHTRPVYIPNRKSVSPDNAPARSRGTRHAGDSVPPSLFPSVSLSFWLSRSRSLSGSAGRSAGTPEIMFGRTAQHGGEEQQSEVER